MRGKHKKHKFAKPVINYPPVPTKKWIPPDKRKKPPKPEPKYVKPEGISQKLAISTLKKVWNKYDVYSDAAIITGHFSQYHRRFSFKSNGLQGACNSAIACVYSSLFKMAYWTKSLLDEILIRGDAIYVRSTQQGDRCLIEVPPEKVHPSFFFGNQKITIFVTPNAKLSVELTSASEEKAKSIIENSLTPFFNDHLSGIFYIKNKYAAIWSQDGVYYYFDPGEHDEYGNPWTGQPGYGFSFLGRFKQMSSLVEYLYKNFPSAKESYAKFHLMPCGIARIVKINIQPPETFEDIAPQDTVFTQIIEELPPLPDAHLETLKSYVEEDKAAMDSVFIKMQEISPHIESDFPGDKRPSFLTEGPVQKGDFCRFPIPLPTYLKGEIAKLTYYTEIVPQSMGILRASTCQTNPNFSKYLGRQSMGNALSALIMLRLCKAKHWIPKTLNTVLKYGDTLYRDAMASIPRTHSLRLSNFPTKIDYEGKTFTPQIEDYALVGQLQSQDFDILELGPALKEFLTDNDCCIILGPQILAVWVEDGDYYIFDPNERDQVGKAIVKTAIVGTNIVNLEPPSGVACVLWFKSIEDLVDLYLNNTEKSRRDERFYLSKIAIKDYIDISEDWHNFKGIDVSKWILRGTFSQASFRFSADSRNVQGTANALMSLAMAILINEQEWTSDIIDEILLSGDSFYKKSIEYLQEKSLLTSPHLMLSELNKDCKLRDKEAHFELEECIVNGLIYGEQFEDLSKGLDNFFRDNEAGVLTTREISLAIWKKDEAYYCVDPYSRDDKGVSTGYGTSCALRFLFIEDLATAIEANLEPDIEDYFNITKVKIILYEAGEGNVKPKLNNYTEINNKSAILRGWQSENDDKYEVRRGRQTVPMCISAVGFNKLKPAVEWSKNDIDIILDKGDALYIDSMTQAQENLEATEEKKKDEVDDAQAAGDAKDSNPPVAKQPEKVAEEEGAGDEGQDGVEQEDEEEEIEEPESEIKITSENVKPELSVGPNNIKLEFADAAQGNIKESLRDSLKDFFREEQTDENFNQEGLLETKHYTVALWRDDKAYYIFDPKPRDKNGMVFGKNDWDPEPPEPEPEPEPDEENQQDEAAEGEEKEEEVLTSDIEVEDDEEIERPPVKVTTEDENEDKEEEEEEGQQEMGEGADEEEDEEESVKQSKEEEKPEIVKPKKSPSYWLQQEKSGRACTIWFTDLNDFVQFIYDNIPVKDRLKTEFTLKRITVINDLKLKTRHHHDDKRTDVYSGDWYDFKELEHGKWILRGSLDASHELFPEANRGKQVLMCSITALAVAHMFEMPCFTEGVPDSMLVYGDKLLTFMKRVRKNQLLNDPKTNLKEDEIDWLVKHENFQITDIPKKICISKFMVEVSITPNHVQGDIKAQTFEDILDIKRGLQKFFETCTYGVLCAKSVYVAIWKGQKMFYMFDGLKRGPSGGQSPNGTACITRYLESDMLADVFLQNLPVHGKNEFVIHKVMLTRNLCPREREPKNIVQAPKAVAKSAGLKVIFPGKYIIRGTISQEDPRFGKGPNIMSAPIALIALTMSLVHKPETWARPIIDEIVVLGSELYEDSVNELGFEFNPWEDKLDIFRVKSAFKLGVVKASCELRNRDQRGVIDAPESNMQNLRQGLEHFFEENTHGILVSDLLTLAVWEQPQDDGEPLIYIFDPNPRSSTGMPLFSGSACAVSFSNATMASNHIIGCILEPSFRSYEYMIVPVEIVVGNARTIRKQLEKSPTRSSINVLRRCSKQVASEQKKVLRKLAEEDRKRKEAKKQQMVGRNGYHLKGNEALLRGYRSQNSDYYDAESRNMQDIPNCIASIVMHSVLPIADWNYRHIDLILDTGNQLYIDSYIAYGPKDPKLGMENILRKFFLSNLEVHVTIYKPVITETFTPNKLNTILEAFFQQESICMLSYSWQWISIFFKGGFYYIFDPHERDIEGNPLCNSTSGSAVVVRFDNINAMALKIINNLGGNIEEAETFSLWIISVQSK